MQTRSVEIEARVAKAYIKVGDLQRKLYEMRVDDPDVQPIDAAQALLTWFQEPENEYVRLDVLLYAIRHIWVVVSAKVDVAILTSGPSSAREKRVAELRIENDRKADARKKRANREGGRRQGHRADRLDAQIHDFQAGPVDAWRDDETRPVTRR